jgi:transcriptional regulator with XRE-family HTH domain
MGKSKETINDRVRMVRKALEMTQQQFADAIKLKTGNTFSMIERGENVVTEQTIMLICIPNKLAQNKTVNEMWLRNGGDPALMFDVPSPGETIIYDKGGNALPRDEGELIGIYRQLTRPNKTVARKQIDVLLEGQGEAAAIEEKGDMRKSG